MALDRVFKIVGQYLNFVLRSCPVPLILYSQLIIKRAIWLLSVASMTKKSGLIQCIAGKVTLLCRGFTKSAREYSN